MSAPLQVLAQGRPQDLLNLHVVVHGELAHGPEHVSVGIQAQLRERRRPLVGIGHLRFLSYRHLETIAAQYKYLHADRRLFAFIETSHIAIDT